MSNKSKKQSINGSNNNAFEELIKAIDDNNQELAINIIKRQPALINKKISTSKLTVLQKSIYKSQGKLFSFLIDHPELKYDVETLLHAINFGHQLMIKKLTANMRKRNIDDKSACRNSLFFEPYMTPLMLACLKNNFSLVQYFKSIGHIIDTVHRADCACDECQKKRKHGEDLESSEKRLAVLRSLASHAWLLQKDCDDPLLKAIMISQEVEKCIDLEVLIRDKLMSLNNHLGKFITGLMSKCSTDEQVRDILRNPVGCSRKCTISLPRLRLALDMNEKDLIAQRKCQRMIIKEWLGAWFDWHLAPPYIRRWRIISHTLFYPILSLLFVFTLGKYPQSCRIPFARFLSFASAHVYYILGLLIIMQYDEPRDERGPPQTFLKQFIYFWIFVYVANKISIMITDLWRLGSRHFLDVWWRKFDVCLNVMQLITFYSFCVAWAQVNIDGIRRAHRAHWSPTDPVLLFEIFFAVSSVMTTWRSFYYVQLNRWMGPTVIVFFWISIGRCIKDVAMYLVVIGVILISFAIGLNYLYEHYKYNAVIRNGINYEQSIHMGSIHFSIRFLYWSFYGYLPPENLAVVVGNSGPNNTETTHDSISIAGEYLVAFYHITVIIVMMNLMVSMMTGTAAKIMENEELEWKYMCTHLQVEYFDDSRSVAPPFGLLQLIVNVFIYLFRKITFRAKGKVLSVWDWSYQNPEFTQKDYDNYVQIMRSLTKKVLAKYHLQLRHLVTEKEENVRSSFKPSIQTKSEISLKKR